MVRIKGNIFSTTIPFPHATVLVLSKLKKLTQPHRNVLKYFAIFENVAHSLEPGEKPSNLASHKSPNYVQRS